MAGRDVTASVETELQQDQTAPRALVEIEFDSGALRLWTGYGDLTALGETWTGAGRIGTIEPIKETQDTVASGVQMSLLIVPTSEAPDAPDQILNIALGEEYQGRPVTIYQAQMDASGALISDPFIRFKGKLDVMEDAELPGGGARITVTAENRLIDLERPRRRTYTPEDQRAHHSDDSFFDYVAEVQNRNIKIE